MTAAFELTIACDNCGCWEMSTDGSPPSIREFRAELAKDGWVTSMVGRPKRLRDSCPGCSGHSEPGPPAIPMTALERHTAEGRFPPLLDNRAGQQVAELVDLQAARRRLR